MKKDLEEKTLQFTGQEFISEILEQMPEATEIFAAHGLSCAGCYVSVYETLEQGAMGHGFDEESINRLLEDLNEAARSIKLKVNINKKNPELTDKAKQKVLEFQKEQGSLGFGFKIHVEMEKNEPSYFLDFLEIPEKGDIVIESKGINLFLDKDSLKKLQNHIIDFGSNEDGEEGFKIEKNN